MTTELTPEEISVAVMAECLQLCPNFGNRAKVIENYLEVYHHEPSIHGIEFTAYVDGVSKQIWPQGKHETYGSPHLLRFLYIALGLETRRAVEAERAKAQKLVEFAETCANDPRSLVSLESEQLNGAIIGLDVDILESQAIAALSAWKGGEND